MNAMTVKDLIKNLQDEDPNATIIYQYYLAEHFDAEEDAFAEVAQQFDSIIPCLDESAFAIWGAVKEEARK